MTVSSASTVVSSPSDVAAAFVTLLTAAGWTNTGGGAMQAPGGGSTFSLAVASSTYDGGPGWSLTCSASGSCPAYVSQPRVNGGTGAVMAPTKLTIFTDPAPGDSNPWAAFVIAFGFNQYRHGYLGFMQNRVGGYTGGEIIAGTHFRNSTRGNGLVDLSENYSTQKLFGGNAAANFGVAGGVNVVHSANPNSWRSFGGLWQASANYTPGTRFTGQNRAMGGYMDDLNDGPFMRSQSLFVGGVTLSPFNLWIDGPGGYFTPIGNPPGIRSVDVSNISPEASISVAGKTWQVFPVYAKTASSGQPDSVSSTGGTWRGEASWAYGYAYEAT